MIDQDKLAHTIAKADFIWMLGETGVMAASPELIDSMFEPFWAADEKIKRRYGYVAEAVARELAKQ